MPITPKPLLSRFKQYGYETMRKQEFIHYHSLLAEVAEQCSEDGLSVDLEAYRGLETQPTSIYLSKSDHKEAVFALTEAISASFPDGQVEAVAAAAD